VERMAYRRVSGVICNAGHEVKHLEKKLGPTFVPVHVVHNGIELAPPQKARSQWRAELDLPGNAVVVAMLANFRPQKDHATLLRAWAKVLHSAGQEASRPFLILAGAPQFTYDEVKRLANELGVLDKVRLPGSVKDVAGLLSACDIGVLTSQHEGLPNAVLEYMAAALPVIATDLPGNREALGDDVESSFCAPNNPDELAVRLGELLPDHNRRINLGMRNRRRAESEFSIHVMCEKTTNIIGSLLNGSEKRKFQ
jgi:glycosyltransferase involved in cell wall biosynthesis